jgi:alanine racemase
MTNYPEKTSNHQPPTKSIIVTQHNGNLPPADTFHRAVHKVRLSALSRNYSLVESAANRQRCSVIVVVKADGYGHGAKATAVALADSCGADAFAVATLEEGIALRKEFRRTAQGTNFQAGGSTNCAGCTAPVSGNAAKSHVSSLFQYPSDGTSATSMMTSQTATLAANNGVRTRSLRPNHIRILVLGPPVGYPRCFDDYYYYNIEVMISGPEVAKALLEWVYNTEERKRTQVQRSASEAKELAMKGHPPPPLRAAPSSGHLSQRDSTVSDQSSGENSQDSNGASESIPRYHPPCATLGNVTGSELAKEVREIMRNQQMAAETQQNQNQNHQQGPQRPASGTTTPKSPVTPVPSVGDLTKPLVATAASTGPVTTQAFAGLEEAAKNSRSRQKAIASEVFLENGDDEDVTEVSPKGNGKPRIPTNTNRNALPLSTVPRLRLRWHALVDSGMGRLGFRTDPVSKEEQGKRRDTVEILKELVNLENNLDCPIEFFGMCTHMAEASSTSDYTNSQIAKFKSLLKRVRAAGISIPTISTDNSAALLTTTLTHFDPKELLTQEFADTRGFVRTGGAIYGQRPTFPQLRAVSTLMVSVRHVAILKKGESVGYDRAYIATMNVRIATLTMGFADGYPRELGNGVGKVSIRGHTFPVAGNVCMDMLMVELGPAGDKESAGAEVVVGDTAVLWGPSDDEEDGEGLVRLQDLARTLKTTQSALTCGLDKERVFRQYG